MPSRRDRQLSTGRAVPPASRRWQPLSQRPRYGTQKPARHPGRMQERERRHSRGRLRFLRGARRFRSILRDGKPSVYLHTSHLQLDEPRCFRWLERAPVFPVFFLHDLIPIEFPEFCSPAHHAAMSFASRRLSDMERRSLQTPRLRGTPCFGRLAQRPVRRLRSCHWQIRSATSPRAVTLMRTHLPYFLHVGTIEGRKNIGHILNTGGTSWKPRGQHARRALSSSDAGDGNARTSGQSSIAA